jgi:hypothetical protein
MPLELFAITWNVNPSFALAIDDPTGRGFAFADKYGLVDCGTSGTGGIEFNQFGRARQASCAGRQNVFFSHIPLPFRFQIDVARNCGAAMRLGALY